jgi:hypothetical protein
VRIQIAVALIAFLLLRLAQALQKTIPSPIVFSKADPRQPHASSLNRQPAQTASNPRRSAANEPKSMLNLNWTAVGQARA